MKFYVRILIVVILISNGIYLFGTGKAEFNPAKPKKLLIEDGEMLKYASYTGLCNIGYETVTITFPEIKFRLTFTPFFSYCIFY